VAFVKAVLPPLLSRYVWRLLRIFLLTPQARALGMVLLGIMLMMLIVPAAFAALLVYLATQNQGDALGVAFGIMLLMFGIIFSLMLALWSKWRKFRRRHLP